MNDKIGLISAEKTEAYDPWGRPGAGAPPKYYVCHNYDNIHSGTNYLYIDTLRKACW